MFHQPFPPPPLQQIILHHPPAKAEVRNTFAYIYIYTSNDVPIEMKSMYTNAPAENISKIPEPFRTAIKNSRLWKWERSEGLETTGCWPSLFPKSYTQDVSFTIWCGMNDGEELTNIFGGQLATFS